MKRKHFLAAMASAATFLAPPVLQAATSTPKRRRHITIPPYLQPGDTIGITSPAGYISEKDIQPAVSKLQEWGYRTAQGSTIGKRDYTFGGTD